MSHPRVLLDTNAWSDLVRGDLAVAGMVRSAERVLMSVVVIGELEFGFRHGRRAEENLALLDDFLGQRVVRVVPVTRATADRFGRVMAQLRAAGRPIPTNDVWIAAHALQTGATLVSRDAHFDAVEGVVVISP